MSGRYIRRILDMEGERFPIYKFMSPKGYIVIGAAKYVMAAIKA